MEIMVYIIAEEYGKKMDLDNFEIKTVVLDGNIYNTHLYNILLNDVYQTRDKRYLNYSDKAFSRMKEYCVLIDKKNDDIFYASGLENFGKNCYRIESRTYKPKNMREKLWSSPSNYLVPRYFLKKYKKNIDFCFKSREGCNIAALTISYKLTDLYTDWKISSQKIELKYKNNFQWIMFNNFSKKPDNFFMEYLAFK